MKARFLPNVVVLSDNENVLMSEAESQDSVLQWYSSEFKPKWHADSGRIFQGTGVIKQTDEETELFLNTIKRYMSEYSDMFSFVGAGTERVSFVTTDQKYCLKLCAPDDGIQNQTKDEVRTYSKFKDAECLYRILDWDERDFTSSICECCRVATEESWENVFGVPYGICMQICQQLFKHKTFSLPDSLKDTIRRYTPNNPEFIDLLLDGKEPAYASLKSWTQIRIDTNGQKLRDAVAHIENWGLTEKDGKPVFKIIDAGL